MASRTPNNATAKLTATTRRRLCLAESTDNGKPQVCIRDLDHTGGHTPAPRDQIPGPVLQRLKDGDTSDLPLEGPGADEFDGVHHPPPDPTPHGPSDALAAKFFPDPPVTADELVAAEQEQAAEAHALAVPDQPRPVEISGRLGADLGGFELIKASYKALFPSASDEMATEYALTMGISDVVGRMLGYHRKPAVADRGLVADLFTLAGQIEQARQVQTP
jgi:hypothetical protein